MKKIIFLLALFTIGFNISFFSNNTEIVTSIDFKTRKFCKTWYVTEAFQIREDRPRRDRTNQAKGSTFTFNKDGSFVMIDKSRSSRKPQEGTWEETGKNSFTITIEREELTFSIKELTRKKLYIIGSEERSANRKIHIVFSSSYVKPYEDQTSDISEYEEMEVTEEIVVDEYDDVEVPPMEEVEEIEMEEQPEEEVVTYLYDKNKLTNEWILTECYINGRNKSNEFIGTSFVFGDDLAFKLKEFHKMNSSPQIGKWNFNNNKIEITKDGITKYYTILVLNENNLRLRETGNSNYSVYSFKRKK